MKKRNADRVHWKPFIRCTLWAKCCMPDSRGVVLLPRGCDLLNTATASWCCPELSEPLSSTKSRGLWLVGQGEVRSCKGLSPCCDRKLLFCVVLLSACSLAVNCKEEVGILLRIWVLGKKGHSAAKLTASQLKNISTGSELES